MKRLTARGFTLVEIMIVVAIIALLAAIAIPNVLRGRTSANEAAAIGNLRALVSSLEMFRSVNNAYPVSAATWGSLYANPPAFGPPSFSVANLTTTRVQGYDYTYAPGTAAGQQYIINANPATVNQTGTRAFFVDESGSIKHCLGASGATVNSVTIDLTPNAPCP